jgi:hypothetical protein
VPQEFLPDMLSFHGDFIEMMSLAFAAIPMKIAGINGINQQQVGNQPSTGQNIAKGYKIQHWRCTLGDKRA